VGLVAELELVSDRYVPLFTWAMLRADLPVDQGWLVFDLGLQFPISSFLVVNDHLGESFHPCAQIHWYPVLDWPWPGTHTDSCPVAVLTQ